LLFFNPEPNMAERKKKVKIIEASGIPDEAGHRFRTKAATDSDRFRPPIPTQGGHPLLT